MTSYLPRKHRIVSVMVDDAEYDSACRTGTHFWRPLTDLSKSPDDWQWTCSNCGVVMGGRPSIMTPHINLSELESMVDSSCRVADKVIEDNQSVYGELWLMRSALWHYWPFKVHCIYHVFQGSPFIMLFRYKENGTQAWLPLNDTDSYKRLLKEADILRQQLNPKVTV